MRIQPLTPAPDARYRRALALNLLGLLLIVAGAAGIAVLGWLIHPYAFAGLCSAASLAGGYVLATKEAA